MTWTTQSTAAGQRHLSAGDPVMAEIIDRVGPFTLRLKRGRFRTLAGSIVSQQISTAAAKTIQKRLHQRLGNRVTAEAVVAMGESGLREVGLSRQKASYLLDLARKSQEGVIRWRRHRQLGDQEIIDELTQVRGIGEWTAQMFLIFSLGRPDILATDDLGIRQAIRQAYQLKELPKPQQCTEIGRPWSPYASMACWYLWRSLES